MVTALGGTHAYAAVRQRSSRPRGALQTSDDQVFFGRYQKPSPTLRAWRFRRLVLL